MPTKHIRTLPTLCFFTALGFACKAEQKCEDASPSVKLSLTVDRRVVTEPIRTLEVQLTLNNETRSRRFELSEELDDGSTSLAFTLAQDAETLDLMVRIDALSESGLLLASAEQRFTGASDGCNTFPLALLATRPDAGPMDAGPFDVPPISSDLGEDADVPLDFGPDVGPDLGPEPDTGVPPSACAQTPDDQTVALYAFSQSSTTTIEDTTGAHPGQLVLVNGTPAFINGPRTCGDGLGFRGGGYAVIPNAPAFQLDEGSVDFWVRIDGEQTNESQGLVSRDASDQANPGHLTISRTCDNHIVVRLQDEVSSVYQCSNQPIPNGEWVHIGVNFGQPGLELYVMGEISTSTLTENFWGANCGGTVQCGGSLESGIAGNFNPWVLGASLQTSVKGGALAPSNPFQGVLDSVRISAARRDFASP